MNALEKAHVIAERRRWQWVRRGKPQPMTFAEKQAMWNARAWLYGMAWRAGKAAEAWRRLAPTTDEVITAWQYCGLVAGRPARA